MRSFSLNLSEINNACKSLSKISWLLSDQKNETSGLGCDVIWPPWMSSEFRTKSQHFDTHSMVLFFAPTNELSEEFSFLATQLWSSDPVVIRRPPTQSWRGPVTLPLCLRLAATNCSNCALFPNLIDRLNHTKPTGLELFSKRGPGCTYSFFIYYGNLIWNFENIRPQNYPCMGGDIFFGCRNLS